MLFPNSSKDLRKAKLESSNDAILRGVHVQKTFHVEAHKKRKVNNENVVAETVYHNEQDAYNKEEYLYLKKMGYVK